LLTVDDFVQFVLQWARHLRPTRRQRYRRHPHAQPGSISPAASLALTIGAFTTADFVIAYDIASPLIGINAVQLLFNGAILCDSPAQVVETVVTPVSHLAGQGQVNVPGTLSDTFNLDGSYTQLRVTKDILLLAADSEGGFAAATISLVDQIYTGVDINPQCAPNCPPDVPEPQAYVMLGAGLVGLYFAKRRM
jgi:hypothetical protein